MRYARFVAGYAILFVGAFGLMYGGIRLALDGVASSAVTHNMGEASKDAKILVRGNQIPAAMLPYKSTQELVLVGNFIEVKHPRAAVEVNEPAEELASDRAALADLADREKKFERFFLETFAAFIDDHDKGVGFAKIREALMKKK
jgi:hypothetical protein